MDGTVHIEEKVLTKDEVAVPFCYTIPFASVEWQVIEMRVLLILVNAGHLDYRHECRPEVPFLIPISTVFY